MATGALSNVQRGVPGQDALTPVASSRAPSRQDQARIAILLQTAARANQAGNSERLKKTLEEILEIDPAHANATYNLGILYRDRDDIFNAEVYLRRAIKLDPDLVDAYHGLGDVLFGAKHLLPAAKVYDEALERAPNRLPLLLNLAKTRMMLKEAREAERLSRRILQIDDRSGEAWSTLSWALLHRGGDAAEALQAAEQALLCGSGAGYAPVLKEHALRRLGRIAEADALWAELLASATAIWSLRRRRWRTTLVVSQSLQAARTWYIQK